jgi:hypothetical protein
MTDAPAAVATTHRIEFDGERVVKTYNSWARGEPLREWRGLMAHAGIRAQELLGRLGLRPDECARIRAYRPAFAVFWLLRLLPGGGAARRNPPGTLAAQAAHLLALPAAD